MARTRWPDLDGCVHSCLRIVGVPAVKAIARRSAFARPIVVLTSVLITLSGVIVATEPASRADPSDYERPPEPLPVVTPTPSNWAPKFPFPYDETKGSVTDADINAEREMCQWFNAQYDELTRQINRLQFNRITPNGPGSSRAPVPTGTTASATFNGKLTSLPQISTSR